MDSSSTTSTSTSTSTSNSPSLRHRHRHRKDKILIIMGPTGSGKSGLSIDLATRFFSSEIINSDKMQVYSGLNITTNKISKNERHGIPHHLLGQIDPLDGDFTPSDFRARAGALISDITSRRKLPLIVGGSNSFIHALVVEGFDPGSNVFDHSDSVSADLRYHCCFLWVDVSPPVLLDYLSKRVDDMLDSGMFDELAEFYDPEEAEPAHRTGLRKAIGVPEFDLYFKKYPPRRKKRESCGDDEGEWDPVRRGAYEEAVREIKENTCRLANRQMGKIQRLRRGGWELKRVDATEAFRALMTSETEENKKWSEIWERQVVEPSVKIVKRFLEE